MVRAILAGEKTQTRRLTRGRGLEWLAPGGFSPDFVALKENHMCPHGDVGDRLWVRESIRRLPPPNDDCSVYIADGAGTVADCWPWKAKALPAIHCPRGLSRIDLEITDVRVQRLQDITEEDARAEGCRPADPATGRECILQPEMGSCRLHFQSLWDVINGKRATWASNPWVWAITFRRVRP